MKITTVSASMRHSEHSQSLKISKYLHQRVQDQAVADEAFFIDLGEKPYPLWDEGIWDGDDEWKQLIDPVGEELASSDGFIFVVPEYHGMAPASIKNFLLIHNKYQLGHKPALLVGVSSSDGGAYPVAEMRMNSSKNNRLCYIPEQLIIRNAESVLNPDNEDNDLSADGYFRDRIDFALGVLKEYAHALRKVRASKDLFDDRFNNGM